ncbi:uncharacterized protein Bfra_009703 [Botrytis fragariae]|uniref:Uncharacterized protein n=1 Tax=Botrytis fragariae TaxID=1964551 RepID=A0A8H6AMW4_9HELO|nr:uncharacterized protein Bfra_009703 [Botrytis fragariae]KAF5870319.1 hypothetical protein Bfra_009703 [Botrytis fragariae]
MAQNWRFKALKFLPLRARKLFISGSASNELVDTHEITNCATLNSNEHLIVTDQFPFLQLPLELRVLIYKKIIPDESVWCNFASRITADHLQNLSKEKTLNTIGLSRKDGDACCPEILSTMKSFRCGMVQENFASG